MLCHFCGAVISMDKIVVALKVKIFNIFKGTEYDELMQEIQCVVWPLYC